ncbi:hypothetical protein [Acrocarpospora sp. B8E8]|uniref:hypothetical protein n=1 Tax=Acrocarpospora sp. B8E8 TaxID=3153572 RepID=UPI00325E7036
MNILPDAEATASPAVLVVPTTRDILARADVGDLVAALYAEGRDVQIMPMSVTSPKCRVLARRNDDYATGSGHDVHAALVEAAIQVPGAATYIKALGEGHTSPADRILASLAEVLTDLGSVDPKNVIMAAAVLASRHELTPVECSDMARNDCWGEVTGAAWREAKRLLGAAEEKALAEAWGEVEPLAVGQEQMVRIAELHGIDAVVTGR